MLQILRSQGLSSSYRLNLKVVRNRGCAVVGRGLGPGIPGAAVPRLFIIPSPRV